MTCKTSQSIALGGFFRPHPYHPLTRANTLSDGKNNRWYCHRPRLAPASLRPLPHQRPFFLAGKSFGVFREGKRRHGEADEAAGLTPGNEENEVRRCFHPEKPYLSLSIDGTIQKNRPIRDRMGRFCITDIQLPLNTLAAQIPASPKPPLGSSGSEGSAGVTGSLGSAG